MSLTPPRVSAALLLPFLSALLLSTKDALLKPATENAGSFGTLWALSVMAALLCWPIVLFGGSGWPELRFWVLLPTLSAVGLLSHTLFLEGLKRTDFSLVGPLWGIAPVVATVSGALVLGEVMGLLFHVGIGLAVIAIFGLGWRSTYDLRQGTSGSVGYFIALFGVVIAGAAASFDKMAIEASSPVLWMAAVSTVWSIALFPAGKRVVNAGHLPLRAIVIASVVGAAGAVAHNYALLLLPVAVAVGLKQSAGLFAVAIGRVSFGEAHPIERAVWASLLGVGVLLMLLGVD